MTLLFAVVSLCELIHFDGLIREKRRWNHRHTQKGLLAKRWHRMWGCNARVHQADAIFQDKDIGLQPFPFRKRCVKIGSKVNIFRGCSRELHNYLLPCRRNFPNLRYKTGEKESDVFPFGAIPINTVRGELIHQYDITLA